MIRPFTAICCLLAAFAVLYTYESKHDVQLIDRQIEKTLADTAALREHSRALKAEWTMRENPERLRTFADEYLSLKPILPNQFTTLADLDGRLPAPRAVAPVKGTNDVTAPSETAQPANIQQGSVAENETTVAEEVLPVPPLPVPPPVAPPVAAVASAAASPPTVPLAAPPAAPPVAVAATAPAPRPAPVRPPVQAAPSVQVAPPVQVAMPASAPPPARPVQVHAARAPAPPSQTRSQTAAMPVAMQAPHPAQGGSLLGMAYTGTMAPAPVPRPMPVNTTRWTYGN